MIKQNAQTHYGGKIATTTFTATDAALGTIAV